jgi:RepB DNA-primase from phage plasmid
MTAAAEPIPQVDGLRIQLACIAGNEPPSSYFELRCLRPDGRPGPREFVPVRELRRAAEIVLALRDVNVYVGAAPRVRESGTAADIERCWALWGDFDTPASVEALPRFAPRPSIVVRTSPGRMQALWPLRHAVTPAAARRGNRRLALALGADMASTDGARILRVIGSRNLKHDPPATVACVRCELDVYELAEVVGSLPDAPGDAPRPPMRVSERGAGTTGSLAGLVRTVREAPEGERNARLFWAACRAADEGHDAREELREVALAVGLPEHEVARTLDSAEQRAAA